jgi:hypothetical protein
VGARQLEHARHVERVLGADHPVDVDAGRADRLGIERAGLDDLLHLGDGAACGRGEDGMEVARPAPVGDVPEAIGAVAADERDVRPQRRLEHVVAVLEAPHLFPRPDLGADPRRGVERRQPRPTRPHAFDQRALRDELERDAPRADAVGHGRRPGGIRGEGGDEPPHLSMLGEDLRGERPDTRRVADERQIAHAPIAQRHEQAHRPVLDDPESADENGGPVPHVGDGGSGARHDLVHAHGAGRWPVTPGPRTAPEQRNGGLAFFPPSPPTLSSASRRECTRCARRIRRTAPGKRRHAACGHAPLLLTE